jgi:hypothetical protein
MGEPPGLQLIAVPQYDRPARTFGRRRELLSGACPRIKLAGWESRTTLSSGFTTKLQRFRGVSCRQIQKSRTSPMQILASDLRVRLETLRTRIPYLNGVLGVHGPDMPPTLGELIWSDGIDSSEYRREYLTLKDVFRALAEGLQRKPSSALEFYSFVSDLSIHELRDVPEIPEADVERLVATWPD